MYCSSIQTVKGGGGSPPYNIAAESVNLINPGGGDPLCIHYITSSRRTVQSVHCTAGLSARCRFPIQKLIRYTVLQLHRTADCTCTVQGRAAQSYSFVTQTPHFQIVSALPNTTFLCQSVSEDPVFHSGIVF